MTSIALSGLVAALAASAGAQISPPPAPQGSVTRTCSTVFASYRDAQRSYRSCADSWSQLLRQMSAQERETSSSLVAYIDAGCQAYDKMEPDDKKKCDGLANAAVLMLAQFTEFYVLTTAKERECAAWTGPEGRLTGLARQRDECMQAVSGMAMAAVERCGGRQRCLQVQP